MTEQEIRLEIVKTIYRHDKTPIDIINNAQVFFEFVCGAKQENASIKNPVPKKPANKLNNNKE